MPPAAELGFLLDHAWLVPALPFISFLIVGLFIAPRSEKVAGVVATLSIFAAAAVAYGIAISYFGRYPAGAAHPALVPCSFEWLRYQEHLAARLGVLVDPISVLLMVVVTTVSALVHLYSLGYMHGERGFGRYFTYLNLFTFSMLGLVVAPNLVQIYVCWELVGVSSFLLIGFYYQKPSAVAASKKAFIVTRFADLGFMLGVLLLGYYGYQCFGEIGPAVAQGAGTALEPFDFRFLSDPQTLTALSKPELLIFGLPLLTVAMVLVYMGAAGKSAMFPLHIWLPDAMEGPTPVSALIHAATMVVAGVYLVARLFPVFAAAPHALTVVMAVGAFTALFAATIGCTQDDIKRVLAFSTLSQLGYMMFALGVATPEHALGYTAAMFHLFTHAFFKALLFLGAGAVIHAIHSNILWEMGGLRKKLPITHATMLIATLAIAGVPPLAGFFSKDEVLAAALRGHHPVVFGLGVLVAGMTAFYMFRLYFLTFAGKARSDAVHHAHEAPVVMLVPLLVLAVLSVVAGWLPMGEYVSFGELAHHGGIDWAVVVPSVAVGLLGIGAAAYFYAGGGARAHAAAQRLGVVYTVIKHKFYFDELYLFVTHQMIFRFVARPIGWFDRHVVDGGVNLSAWVTRWCGTAISRSQSADVQAYGSWVVGGVVIVVFFLIWALKG